MSAELAIAAQPERAEVSITERDLERMPLALREKLCTDAFLYAVEHRMDIQNDIDPLTRTHTLRFIPNP